MHVAADVPLSDRLRTKWLAASDESEGFMPSLSAPASLGGYDNLLFRADVLWQPTDRFSLRFNATEDDRESVPARVMRMSNPEGLYVVAYNVLAGNPERLAQARAINPAFPAPPFALRPTATRPHHTKRAFQADKSGAGKHARISRGRLGSTTNMGS